MKQVEIDGKSYPIRVSMGALLEFQQQTGKELSDLQGSNDVDSIIMLLYCCVKGACKFTSVDFDMSYEQFAYGISPDEFTKAMSILFTQDDSKKK